MTTSFRLPRDTLKEILDSNDELVKGADIDLNITTQDGGVLLYIRLGTMSLVHELVPNEDVKVSVDEDGERICLNPEKLNEAVTKASEGTLEIEFHDHDYVVKYEGERIFSETLTLRLKRFVETEFQEPPRFGELKKLGTLERASLHRALDMMSTVSPTVKVAVENGVLSLEVSDKVYGEGGVNPKLTNTEMDQFEAKYSIEPLIDFLGKVTSGDEVVLQANPSGRLLLEVESSNMISRLFITQQVDSLG